MCVALFCVLVSVLFVELFFFFFKQKTAYEMRISDWSSDVCSSDLLVMAFGYFTMYGPAGYVTVFIQSIVGVQPWNLYSIGGMAVVAGVAQEIGRASCRERVCQYV